METHICSGTVFNFHVEIVVLLCVIVSSFFCIFFFFQAEDGIRDYKVTGVQTCALPILGPLGQGDVTWNYGFLFSAALTVGGGTSEVQRNIVAERVLGLPHDPDVETG